MTPSFTTKSSRLQKVEENLISEALNFFGSGLRIKKSVLELLISFFVAKIVKIAKLKCITEKSVGRDYLFTFDTKNQKTYCILKGPIKPHQNYKFLKIC